MKLGRCLTLQRMVELAGLSRASYYRFDQSRASGDADMELRDAIQRIALEWPSYGRRRVTHELRRRGRTHIDVCWVGPVPPYAAVGGRVSNVYFVYRRELS